METPGTVAVYWQDMGQEGSEGGWDFASPPTSEPEAPAESGGGAGHAAPEGPGSFWDDLDSGAILGPQEAAPPSNGGPSKASLMLERAALQGKKAGARALDSAMFAPLVAIDQLSVADVRAVDAVNFVGGGFKGKGERKKDLIDYKPKFWGQKKANPETDRVIRDVGRTGLRDMASTGGHLPSAIAGHKKMGAPKWDWGKGTTGVNPVAKLRTMGLGADAAPETKDNRRLGEIKQALHAKDLRKKQRKQGAAVEEEA